jgi:large subunit ribosomal protein L37Ae
MAGKKVGTAGRFGARYGNTLRRKVSEIEKISRAKHKCPFCGKEGKVKRQAYGIWKCTACEKVFIGKAYRPN